MITDIIRISRNKIIKNSREEAILFLNGVTHRTGQQWQVMYYCDEEKTKIDTLLAIGVRDGTGIDSYNIISYGSKITIAKITDTLPDVSELIHGEIYIVNIDDVWNYVTLVNNTRYITPIDEEESFTYYNVEDGHTWFFNEGKLKRDDDFAEQEETIKYIEEIREQIVVLEEEIDTKIDTEIDQIKSDIEGINSTLEEHSTELESINTTLEDHDARITSNKNEITGIIDYLFPLEVTVQSNPSSGKVWASGSTNSATFTLSAKAKGSSVTNDTNFDYKGNGVDWTPITENPLTLTGITGINKTVTYNFRGTWNGTTKAASSNISFNFGLYYLYGVTSGVISNIDDLTSSNVTTRQTYYSIKYTTTLQNLATFAVPYAWGKITKITDGNGVNEYTSSFSLLTWDEGSETVNREIGGVSIPFYVYRWSSLPTIQTNFAYRFYH